RLHAPTARMAKLLGRQLQARLVASRERHLAGSTARRELAHERDGDLRGASEDQHLPRQVSAIAHSHSPRRRARSERSVPRGSTLARSSLKRSRPGYIAASVCGRRRASLARYTRPPAAATSSSAASSASRRPAASAGMSTASVQPSSGNESRPPEPGPKRLSTARYIGNRRARNPCTILTSSS